MPRSWRHFPIGYVPGGWLRCGTAGNPFGGMAAPTFAVVARVSQQCLALGPPLVYDRLHAVRFRHGGGLDPMASATSFLNLMHRAETVLINFQRCGRQQVHGRQHRSRGDHDRISQPPGDLQRGRNIQRRTVRADHCILDASPSTVPWTMQTPAPAPVDS